MLWVCILLIWGVLDTTLCDKVCQWLAGGLWFSPVSSTKKTDCHYISEILLRVALNTITLNPLKIGVMWLSAFDTFKLFIMILYNLYIIIDSEGRLRTKLYDEREDFNFLIVNFPFICSYIPAAPAYWVYIFKLVRYYRACGSYHDFLDRLFLLTKNILNQWFLVVKLKSSLRSPPWLNNPLRNICFTNIRTSRTYSPFVVITMGSFPIHNLSPNI
jgi:hypothetical protein